MIERMETKVTGSEDMSRSWFENHDLVALSVNPRPAHSGFVVERRICVVVSRILVGDKKS